MTKNPKATTKAAPLSKKTSLKGMKVSTKVISSRLAGNHNETLLVK